MTSTGSFTSACRPPQRLIVTMLQFACANSTSTIASSTQNRVFRNCIETPFRGSSFPLSICRPRPEGPVRAGRRSHPISRSSASNNAGMAASRSFSSARMARKAPRFALSKGRASGERAAAVAELADRAGHTASLSVLQVSSRGAGPHILAATYGPEGRPRL